MKKLLVLLMVLGIVAPSMAAVTLTGTGSGLTATIGVTWTNGTRPRAFGLTLDTQNAGVTIDTVGGFKTGVSTSSSRGYGIFPGSIVIDGSGNVTNPGTPVEPNTLPGGGKLGTHRVIVALGSLYSPTGDANAPTSGTQLFTVTVSGNCTLRITPETQYRGGVVDENGVTMSVTPNPLDVTLASAPTECVKASAPFYAVWDQFSKPDCWCYQRNCHGDADGVKQFSYWVFTNDLTILKSAYSKQDQDLTGNMICADFDRTKQFSYRVFTQDLTILKQYYSKQEVDNPVCDMTNYNFWKN